MYDFSCIRPLILPVFFSLICPLHCRLIHHTHPAQSHMTKCKITLIHDLQLFCNAGTNKTQQCCCRLCRMEAKNKKTNKKPRAIYSTPGELCTVGLQYSVVVQLHLYLSSSLSLVSHVLKLQTSLSQWHRYS